MYFTFNQNNTGGSLNYDAKRGISHFVIIEADNLKAAMKRAEKIGLYFDSVDAGLDCGCCGDRWYPPWDEKGTDTPLVYGEPASQYPKDGQHNIKWLKGYEIFVHHQDGSFEGFWREEVKK